MQYCTLSTNINKSYFNICYIFYTDNNILKLNFQSQLYLKHSFLYQKKFIIILFLSFKHINQDQEFNSINNCNSNYIVQYNILYCELFMFSE